MAYEPTRAPMAVILAAGTGARLAPRTDTCPKSLLPVGGSMILERIIRNCLSCGISQFVLVLGHRADQIKQLVDKTFRGIRVTYVINERYRETNTGYSLMLASGAIGGAEFIKFDADVVFDVKILRALVDSSHANVLCIDHNNALEVSDVKVITDDQKQVLKVGTSVDAKSAAGVSIGIEKISAKAGPLLFKELTEMIEDSAHHRFCYEEAYDRLVAKGTTFYGLDITGLNWTGIDTEADFAAANALFSKAVTTVSRSQQRALDEENTKAEAPESLES